MNGNKVTFLTFKQRATFRFFVVFSFFFGTTFSSLRAVDDETLTIKVSRNYLRSFSIAKSLTHPPESRVACSGDKNIHKFIEQSQVIKMASTTQRKIVFRHIFSNIQQYRSENMHELLNYNAWNDLGIFYGSVANPNYHLLSRINRTTTVVGECALAMLLVTPTTDVSILTNRQAGIQELLQDKSSFMECEKLLNHYLPSEQRLLSFWTSTDPLYSQVYQDYMQKRFYSTNPAKNKRIQYLRLCCGLRNMMDIYGEFLALPVAGSALCGLNHLSAQISGLLGGKVSLQDSFSSFPFFVPFWSLKFVVNNYLNNKNLGGPGSILPFLGSGIVHGMALWRGYCGVSNYKEYADVFKNLAMRLRDVQIFLQAVDQLNELIKKNPTLERVYGPQLSAIRTLLDQGKQPRSGEVGAMVDHLLHMKFENWSYLLGDNGRLLATYNLFQAHKDVLQLAMHELGQLDAYIGIARLMQEAQHHAPAHCYTFARFLDRSAQNTPLICFQAMWNPLLDPLTVVDNEAKMSSDDVRNMVICGPNAGGKSSFLSSVAINLLLSQTFGITAAQQAVLTPFNHISTYIEIGDDIASGASLFMVEVHRIRKHIQLLERLKDDQFTFAIFDEPFSGTNPIEAGASAYSILAYMAKYRNALHIVASHYPILMRLQSGFPGRGIRNFKVLVKEDQDHKLNYTYKVVPGQARQTVALKILAQEGYDKFLLEEAESVVKHIKGIKGDDRKNQKRSTTH